jgi:hypothetical protein
MQSFCYFMQELLGEDNVQVKIIKMFSMWTHASTMESLLQIMIFQKVQLDYNVHIDQKYVYFD